MLASSQGGINIEEVARDDPDSILTEPVDIDAGMTEEQARRVATFMGFEGDKVDQVRIPYVTDVVLILLSPTNAAGNVLGHVCLSQCDFR